MILTIDPYGNIEDYKEAIALKISQTPSNVGNSGHQQHQQICHECQKLDLRAQAETSQAYNQ